jgi:hypothetical protein
VGRLDGTILSEEIVLLYLVQTHPGLWLQISHPSRYPGVIPVLLLHFWPAQVHAPRASTLVLTDGERCWVQQEGRTVVWREAERGELFCDAAWEFLRARVAQGLETDG